MSGTERKRCTYSGCDRPSESNNFLRIGEGKTTGGQDWSSIVGSVLCQACYSRFRKRGTLERAQVQGRQPLLESERRCTNEHCDKPQDSRHFFRIGEGKTAGGQDWSFLVGSVLCRTCYSRFTYRGTLERAQVQGRQPLLESERRCTNEHCDKPQDSNHFLRIGEGKTAGGQDWSSLVGSVLCQACYERSKNRGTLERARGQGRPLLESERRCTNEHCDKPQDSSQFYQIGEGKATGGRDWSSLAGSVLCQACYTRFRKRGNLERARVQGGPPLLESERQCTNEHCDKPQDSSQFYRIGEGKTAGGQDWSSIVGSVLCSACYTRFCKKGTLEVSAAHVRKKRKTANRNLSKPSSSKRPQTARSTYEEQEEVEEEEGEEEEEEAPDTGECMVCLAESRTMCIVPCGHFGLCAPCGDESLFAGKKRPYSDCPICREEMCEPYVMERWVWEELGGTTYYS